MESTSSPTTRWRPTEPPKLQNGEIAMYGCAIFGAVMVFIACLYYRCCKSNERRKKPANGTGTPGEVPYSARIGAGTSGGGQWQMKMGVSSMEGNVGTGHPFGTGPIHGYTKSGFGLGEKLQPKYEAMKSHKKRGVRV